MKDKTALIAALAELDYEDTPEDMVMNVLDATRKAWTNMTQADYNKLVWQDERKDIQRVEYEMNGVDE